MSLWRDTSQQRFGSLQLRMFTTTTARCAERARKTSPPEPTSRTTTQTWSAYMGEEGDDSPWASLDAFADNLSNTSESHNIGMAATQTSAPSPAKNTTSLDQFEIAAAAAAEAYASSRSQREPPSSLRKRLIASPRLTHIDEARNDRASMVDISSKTTSHRSATASCKVFVPDAILALLDPVGREAMPTERSSALKAKGPVLHTAQLAGIMAAKRTSELIPLCHGLHLSHVDVQLEVVDGQSFDPIVESFISVVCTATTTSGTGVEMEALTGASVASLTLWDMLKSAGGKEMRIDGLMVLRKSGGKSGDFIRLNDQTVKA